MGTPVQMYDSEGNKTWDCTLDIYGKVADFRGESLYDCPFRFQGQYEDAETGLYYNRFRYYGPNMGMYVSQDPIRLNGGNTLYSYVQNCNIWNDYFGLSTVYLRNGEVYVGKAKWNAKRRYNNKSVATDIFTEIPNTSTAQGVEQIVYERMKKLVEIGKLDPMTNINAPINMRNKHKRYRRKDGEAWLKRNFGDNYQEIIDEKIAEHYKSKGMYH